MHGHVVVKKLEVLHISVNPVTTVMGRDSSVSIATRYELDSPGIESRYGKYFPHSSRPALGLTVLPKQWVPGIYRA